MSVCIGVGGNVYLSFGPGDCALKDRVFGAVSGQVSEALETALCEAIAIGETRTREQDARFGLIVSAEIASKALSPGINDAGTGPITVRSLTELLWGCPGARPDPQDAPEHWGTNVFVAAPGPADLLCAAFEPLTRDGAGHEEVALPIKQALETLAERGDATFVEESQRLTERRRTHAVDAGLSPQDLARLRHFLEETSALDRGA